MFWGSGERVRVKQPGSVARAAASGTLHVEWEMECGCTGMEVEAVSLLMPLLRDPSFVVRTNNCDKLCEGYPSEDVKLLRAASERALTEIDVKVYHVAFRGICATSHNEGGPRPRVIVARSMSEVDQLDSDAVRRCNDERTAEVWVPSLFNKQSFEASGVLGSKIKILPESINMDLWVPSTVPPAVLPGRAAGFVFLSVFKFEPRKNWKQLIEAFLREFESDEDVKLVIKTRRVPWLPDDPELALEHLAAALEQDGVHQAASRVTGPSAQVALIDAELDVPKLVAMFEAAHAFVLPSHGEGWGLPLMEAMAMGLPTIGTRWGGNTVLPQPILLCVACEFWAVRLL